MTPTTFTRKLHIHIGRNTRRELRPGAAPKRPKYRTPRISKLMRSEERRVGKECS